jgi:hypothetical protein
MVTVEQVVHLRTDQQPARALSALEVVTALRVVEVVEVVAL